MKRQIIITIGKTIATADLGDTGTADAIWEVLPLRSIASTWGNEIYFGIPVKVGLENGKEVVNAGDLGYWPPGSAFCIFFGQTPVSRPGEIRAASAVNIFGKLTSSPELLKNVRDGEEIEVDRV